jgi:hypothetical protein
VPASAADHDEFGSSHTTGAVIPCQNLASAPARMKQTRAPRQRPSPSSSIDFHSRQRGLGLVMVPSVEPPGFQARPATNVA